MKHPLAVLVLIPLVCWANSDEVPIQALVADMASLTQSAKNQRANINYLPYIMSVFDGEELSIPAPPRSKKRSPLSPGSISLATTSPFSTLSFTVPTRQPTVKAS